MLQNQMIRRLSFWKNIYTDIIQTKHTLKKSCNRKVNFIHDTTVVNLHVSFFFCSGLLLIQFCHLFLKAPGIIVSSILLHLFRKFGSMDL